jgi:putative sigma-54 modulation protein
LLFTISGKHIDITEAIRNYAEQKTSKLPRFYNGINQIEVIIDCEPAGGINVEIIARGEHSNVFIGAERGGDVYGCMDIAVRKLERQLKRKKGKERDNKKHAGGVEKGTL